MELVTPELLAALGQTGGAALVAVLIGGKLLLNGRGKKIDETHDAIQQIRATQGEVVEVIHGVDKRLVRVETQLEVESRERGGVPRVSKGRRATDKGEA